MTERATTNVPEKIRIRMGTFEPCVVDDTQADTFSFYEEDCSITEEQVPGSCFVVFRSNQTGKVVGGRIENYSKFPLHQV